MATEAKNVHDIVDEIIKDPTIDKLLDRHPKTLKWPDDYMAMVMAQRRNRAMFIQSDAEKRSKRRNPDA